MEIDSLPGRLLFVAALPAIVALSVSASSPAVGAEPEPEAAAFFESAIRPLLSDRCFECHGEEKQKGGLRLDARGFLLQGGESGPAIVPGKPSESLLMLAVAYSDADLQMPPKERLGRRAIENVRKWIAMGAPWPGGASRAGEESGNAGEDDAFVITEADRGYWAFQPLSSPPAGGSIDAIVSEALETKGLTANPEASRETLVRRAYFDLVGLPPAYGEVQAFVNDPDPDAYSHLIDRLLAMPEYGERWGRHWLDVVRYAQTNGYERDDEKPESWRYRDYVIDSFNEDKPYDRFILEQLAGDELPGAGDTGLIATGFYRLGVYDDEPDDLRAAEFDGLDDMLKTTTETFLGLTVGCARCHDHMFDPVSQRDYYQLLAFFRNIQPNAKENLAGIASGKAMTVAELGPEPKETHVLIRGNPGRPAARVEPRFPEILGGAHPPVEPTASSSGRRLALARWIASEDNPLTARVMTNRVWQYHFGRGIVATPNDLGKAGQPPANRALVDWLAAEFVKGNWSVKHLHRVVMRSAAYRRSSGPNPANDAIDPGNEFVWRQNMRRLESEVIRDSILAVAGALNPKRGGDRGFYPAVAGEVVAGASRPGRGWGWSPDDEQKRRSVYAFVKRTMLYPFFEIFDYANTEGSLGARPVTTVAPQALLLLNGEFIAENAERIARRVESDADPVGKAFQAVLARDPTASEREMASDYLTLSKERHTALSGRVRFSPDYSTALFKDYQAVIPAHRFLRGPREHWTYHKGRWTGDYEGIVNSEPDYSPFALFHRTGRDMKTSGRLEFSPAAKRVAVFLRASINQERSEEFDGYEFLVDLERRRIAIRKFAGGVAATLAETSLAAPTEPEPEFFAEVEGSTLLFRLGESEISATDDSAPTASGNLGVMARGGPVAFSHWNLHTDGIHIHPGRPQSPDAHASRLAFEAFCALLLNLNEFVYVD